MFHQTPVVYLGEGDMRVVLVEAVCIVDRLGKAEKQSGAGSDWEDEDLTARWQRVQTKWGL